MTAKCKHNAFLSLDRAWNTPNTVSRAYLLVNVRCDLKFYGRAAAEWYRVLLLLLLLVYVVDVTSSKNITESSRAICSEGIYTKEVL